MITSVQSIHERCIECKNKVDMHTRNAQSSRGWNNTLSLLGVILSAGTALAMTIMTVEKANNIALTITGAVFAFSISITQKIKESYNFEVLSFQHNSAADDFHDLYFGFMNLANKFDEVEFEKLMVRYVSLCQKYHLQSIKDCKIFCCFKT